MEENTVHNTTPKTSVGKDALYLTGSRILTSVIGVVTSMLLARFRTLDEYGTYSQIIMVTDLVSSILLLGLPNSINFFLAKADTQKDRQDFMSVYTTLSTILTVVISVCLFLSMPIIISHFSNPLIRDFAYVFAVYPWSSIFINSISSVCVVYGKSNRLIFYNLANALTVLGVLLIAKIADLSFHQYMLMYMAVLVLFAVAAIVWSNQLTGRIRIKLDFSLIKSIFIFSIPLGLASASGTLSHELGKLVIGRFFSVDEYAIFANASRELPVTLIATTLTAVLLPQLVRLIKNGHHYDAVSLWGNAIEISLCFMCLIAGGFIVFAPDILSLFYSEKYVTDGGVLVFRIYSIILLLRATYWGIILNATGNTKFIFYSSLISLLLNLVINVASIYVLGFIGPAVSSLIVSIALSFIQLYFTTKVIKVPFKQIFPWRSIIRLIIMSVGFCVVFATIKYSLLPDFNRSTSILISLGLGAVWSAIYIICNLNLIKRSWQQLNANKYNVECE